MPDQAPVPDLTQGQRALEIALASFLSAAGVGGPRAREIAAHLVYGVPCGLDNLQGLLTLVLVKLDALDKRVQALEKAYGTP